MEFFEPTSYQHQHQHQHQHAHYPHGQMSHYNDAHHTYAMAQSSPMIAIPNTAKQGETKPRLGKDEVDILEHEFKKNPKPTTQTKRQFAEDMGVDLARINNWFQNRRAKRKQEKKQEAHEAGQAQEALAYSEPSSPDFYSNGSGYYSDNGLPLQQPAGPFALVSGPPPAVAPYNPQYSDPPTASIESLQRTMAAAQAASDHDKFNFMDQHDSTAHFRGSLHGYANSDRAQFPSPDESMDHFNGSQTYSYPSSFSNSLYISPSRSQSLLEVQSPGEGTANHTPTPFNNNNFQSSRPEHSMTQLTTTFPSQLLPPQLSESSEQQNGSQFMQSPESIHESTLGIGFKYETEGSEQACELPPGPSIPFRSPPPPMDIASRRQKVRVKPAALMAETLRGRPSLGPRTVSHAEGLRLPTESPASSPMRRIVSAGGNRNVLSGRIQKSGIESSQRSPINLGGFPDASSFLEHNYQNIRGAPSLTAGSSLNSLHSSLAPPTPMSPREREMTFLKRESARSTASPVEGGVNFVFNTGVPGCFTTIEGDQNLASPPETPQAHMTINVASNGWLNTLDMSDMSDKSWQYDVADEALYTPAQDSFTMEIHMPQPSYFSSTSQPVTPAFGQFNPNFTFGHESPQYKNEAPQYTLSTQNGSEYSFPDSHTHFMGMSPASARQKTFQFSHTTAADFSEK